MQFDSATFVAFFATVLIAYALTPGWSARKNWLLAAVCLAALALAGCQGRGLGDVTGSIGRSSQASRRMAATASSRRGQGSDALCDEPERRDGRGMAGVCASAPAAA